MTIESDLVGVIAPLVSNRVFPDVAPASTPKPYVTYQQVGGEAINFLEGGRPGRRNGRFQVNIWASRRVDANALARNIEDALLNSPTLRATVLGAAIWVIEDELSLYGTRQDFSIWY